MSDLSTISQKFLGYTTIVENKGKGGISTHISAESAAAYAIERKDSRALASVTGNPESSLQDTAPANAADIEKFDKEKLLPLRTEIYQLLTTTDPAISAIWKDPVKRDILEKMFLALGGEIKPENNGKTYVNPEISTRKANDAYDIATKKVETVPSAPSSQPESQPPVTDPNQPVIVNLTPDIQTKLKTNYETTFKQELAKPAFASMTIPDALVQKAGNSIYQNIFIRDGAGNAIQVDKAFIDSQNLAKDAIESKSLTASYHILSGELDASIETEALQTVLVNHLIRAGVATNNATDDPTTNLNKKLQIITSPFVEQSDGSKERGALHATLWAATLDSDPGVKNTVNLLVNFENLQKDITPQLLDKKAAQNLLGILIAEVSVGAGQQGDTAERCKAILKIFAEKKEEIAQLLPTVAAELVKEPIDLAKLQSAIEKELKVEEPPGRDNAEPPPSREKSRTEREYTTRFNIPDIGPPPDDKPEKPEGFNIADYLKGRTAPTLLNTFTTSLAYRQQVNQYNQYMKQYANYMKNYNPSFASMGGMGMGGMGMGGMDMSSMGMGGMGMGGMDMSSMGMGGMDMGGMGGFA